MSEKLFTFAAGDEPSTLTRRAILPAQIVTYESGLEQRNLIWIHPRFGFTLTWDSPLRDVAVNSVINFFVEHGGDLRTFLFQPELFSAGTGSLQALGIGTGARHEYKVHGNRFGAAQVFVDGASRAATYAPGIGMITITAAPASGAVVTAWVSSERFVVRFAESTLNQEWFFWQLARGQTVTLIQDKGVV
jgi:hypothetical protein